MADLAASRQHSLPENRTRSTCCPNSPSSVTIAPSERADQRAPSSPLSEYLYLSLQILFQRRRWPSALRASADIFSVSTPLICCASVESRGGFLFSSMMAVANDLLSYQISVYSVVYRHSPTPPKPTVNESRFCSSPPLSAPATRLHLPVSYRLPPSGAEAKNPSPFSPSSRLMSILGKATQTPQTHGFISVFGVWGEIKGGEVPVVHQRISWTRFGTTFSDRGRRTESSWKGQMHLEPCSYPLLSVSPRSEVPLKPPNDALRLPLSKDVSLSSLVGVRLLIP